MRPTLKPGLRTVWRDSSTLQVGLDPDRAMVITGIGAGDARLVAALDGTRDLPGLLTLAGEMGVDDARASRLLALLGEGGALADAATPTGTWSSLEPAERDRLAPDLASCALSTTDGTAGHAVLSRRRAAGVLVEGAGRVGAAVATLLAAAGIGAVAIRDEGRAVAGDAGPAGFPPAATGSRRADAVRAAVRRAAPSTTTSLPRASAKPTVVVIAPVAGQGLEPAERWLRADVPHLYAGVRETTGVVGPFVIPGRSSCLHCADLHRSDRDPGWPAVAAQLVGSETAGACDVALATLVAAQAALQVVGFLDGGPPPPAVGGTLETRVPGGATRRRPWAVHPACGCTDEQSEREQ